MATDQEGITPERKGPSQEVQDYARRAFEDLLPEFDKIRKAARKMRFDRGTAVINALNAIESRMTEVVGEYVGLCPECGEAMFDHEMAAIDDEGTYAHKECAEKLFGRHST